jgi:hypothetical protein
MFSIWKKVSDESWELVEELQDDLALAQRLADLRGDGLEYRAEKRDGATSSILGV